MKSKEQRTENFGAGTRSRQRGFGPTGATGREPGKLVSYLEVALATTSNIVLNAATLGRFVLLEGRVRGGVFKNWAGRFSYTPRRFSKPTTEAEVVDLIKCSRSLRVFGSGHSFNEGVVSDGVLVSLDDFSGPVEEDPERVRELRAKDQLAVKGGTRVRDVVKLLLKEGLAFEALPSHDAQSIAGILSTDVHGTGRDWGFVSESVVSLRLVDGEGEVRECRPSDDLFKAAIGGVGAVGIITEVVVQGVPRFNVEQKVEISDVSSVERDLDGLLRANEHLSLYLFPFTDKCQVNTWNRTEKPRSTLGGLWEFLSISADALIAAWAGNLIAYTRLLPKFSPRIYEIKERGTNLVLESNEAFNRTIYHLHQELEFTVPFEETFEACRSFIELYEKFYRESPSGLPYTLFEVRFTPEHDRTLIGAGRGRRSAWIDLVCNDSRGFREYYAEAQKLIREMRARPHLGKFCEDFDEAYLADVHGENYAKFLSLVEEHDPDRKFSNKLTRRLFGR